MPDGYLQSNGQADRQGRSGRPGSPPKPRSSGYVVIESLDHALRTVGEPQRPAVLREACAVGAADTVEKAVHSQVGMEREDRSNSPTPRRCRATLTDGHTLTTVIPEIETLIGANLARVFAYRGYRGQNAPPDHKFKVYISGQRRRVTETIKRELRRRSAVEPVIGHSKAEHRMGRNYLAGTHGDAAHAVLAAAGYNFRRLLEWLALLLSNNPGRPQRRNQPRSFAQPSLKAFFTDDYTCLIG
jgi:hypothetical protein